MDEVLDVAKVGGHLGLAAIIEGRVSMIDIMRRIEGKCQQ
jgi:hypothetical protein